jgi:hypothetical protein
MERLWVDFNNMGKDGVRLTCSGTLNELNDKAIILYNGLKLIAWMEDEDDNGKADNLLVEAVVKYSFKDNCWVAQFDGDKLIHESQIEKH